MSKKLLITGTGGFIFSNMLRKLIYEKSDYKIVSIDKISNPSSLNNIYQNKNHAFYMGDISDAHFVNNVFAHEKPDFVINGAAESAVDASLINPNKFITSNVMGTQVMLNAIKHGVKKFLHISSDEVYGALNSEQEASWTEESPMAPRNPYAASKAAAELMVRAAGLAHGIEYNITRASNNYGPRQFTDKLIPRTIKKILNNEQIPIYGKGAQIRDWTFVHDHGNGILKVLESGAANETYNIAAGCELSNLELVNKICNIMKRGHELITFIPDPRGNAHDFRYSVNCDKIRKLGWKTETSFKDGLEETVFWYQNNKWFVNSL
jgi:dTDP-glucose 4,6-dehydratase